MLRVIPIGTELFALKNWQLFLASLDSYLADIVLLLFVALLQIAIENTK